MVGTLDVRNLNTRKVISVARCAYQKRLDDHLPLRGFENSRFLTLSKYKAVSDFGRFYIQNTRRVKRTILYQLNKRKLGIEEDEFNAKLHLYIMSLCWYSIKCPKKKLHTKRSHKRQEGVVALVKTPKVRKGAK